MTAIEIPSAKPSVRRREYASDAEYTVQDIPLIRAAPPEWPLSRHVERQRRRWAFWADVDARERLLARLAAVATGSLTLATLAGILTLGMAINRVAPPAQASHTPTAKPTAAPHATTKKAASHPPTFTQPQPPAPVNPPHTIIGNPWGSGYPGPPIIVTGGILKHGGGHHHR